MLSQAAQAGDLFLLSGLEDRTFDERRAAVMNQFPCDPVRSGTDPGNGLERIGLDERRDLPVQTQHRLRGACVAERARRLTGQMRQVEQQSRQRQVDVHRGPSSSPYYVSGI